MMATKNFICLVKGHNWERDSFSVINDVEFPVCTTCRVPICCARRCVEEVPNPTSNTPLYCRKHS